MHLVSFINIHLYVVDGVVFIPEKWPLAMQPCGLGCGTNVLGEL